MRLRKFRGQLLAWASRPEVLNRVAMPLVVIVPLAIVALGWPKAPRGISAFQEQGAVASAKDREEPIQALPLSVDLNPGKIALGERLFSDGGLSKDGTVSCATCHDLAKGGTDGKPRSLGMNGAPGDINSPTVFNAVYNFRQFWDGRAASLEDQMNGPVANPAEMASSWEHVLKYIESKPDYRRAFRDIYGGRATRDRVRDSIAEFERSLTTPNSPFDRYLRGDANALGPEQLEGYRLFKENGCVACHQGRNVGGNMFQTFGVLGNYFKERGTQITKADLGRFNVTGQEADRHVFKVPSLRNIALTAPYFHDGSAATLEQAVAVMARYQLGRTFTARETASIIAFLRSLTGDYRGKRL